MIAIENGWSDTVEINTPNNVTVPVAVLFRDGVPERVSVRTDDGGLSSIGPNAVQAVLAQLGYTARLTWEAGEGEGEDVAFLSSVEVVS